MKIDRMPIAALHAAEYNPRKALAQGDKNYERLKKSIERFGYINPIIYNDVTGRIVGGHQRATALRDMGIGEVDVVTVSMSEEEERLLNIALNSVKGKWSFPKLIDLVNDIGALMDRSKMETIGIDEAKILKIARGIGKDRLEECESEREPEEGEQVAYGTICELGRHRIICGDSRDPDILKALFRDDRYDFYCSDPPFGVELDKKNDKFLLSNGNDWQFVYKDLKSCEAAARLAVDTLEASYAYGRPGSPVLLWGTAVNLFYYSRFIDCKKIVKAYNLIWMKNCISISQMARLFNSQYESIYYAWIAGDKPRFEASHVSSVLKFDKPSKHEFHIAQKPIDLMEYIISFSTRAGHIVYDAFLGSGSTLIASEKSGRTCYGVESDGKSFEMIRSRYEQYKNKNDSN